MGFYGGRWWGELESRPRCALISGFFVKRGSVSLVYPARLRTRWTGGNRFCDEERGLEVF